ncbi:unnamed protein product, partial [Bubo scandiacus]
MPKHYEGFSQKSQQIQELLQQVEDLKKGLDDAENCNKQLKIKLNETANQDHQCTKEKDLMNQLQEHIQKETQDFGKQAAEGHRVIAQLEVTSYKGKIRELECLLEAFRAKDDSTAKLEEVLKGKESVILNLERNTAALQEECAHSDKNLKELNDQEANLKEEVVQLMNSLENMKHTLRGREKISNTGLRKDLSESSALVQSLRKALQREEEEHADLKEKLSDAKKQIQQVQNQERLAAQLVGEASNLQKWREERDQLVEAWEVQLRLWLLTPHKRDERTDTEELRKQVAEKDGFIKELKQGVSHKSLQSFAEVPLPEGQDRTDQSVNKEDHSEIVLDSSEVSTENGNTGRFPKPGMEMQFTALQPSQMEVKHQGSTSPVPVKVLKPRKKRTSEEMDE